MSEPEPSTQVEEEVNPKPAVSAARARAEARRRRILNQSKNRMQAVSGDPTPVTTPAPVPASDPTPDAEEPDEAEENAGTPETENVEENEGTEKVVDEVVETPVPTSPAKTPTGRNRYAQLRRRYKAAKASKEESVTTETADASEETSAKTEEKIAETPATESEDKAEETVTETEAEVPSVKTPAPDQEEVKPSQATTGEKKKYKGVAKMRRMRLAEEKARKEAELESKIESDLKKSAASVAKFSAPKPVALKPILFQLFTVLALFLVGFDVGIQNHALVQQDVPNVHMDLFFVDNGIALFGAKQDSGASIASQDTLSGIDDKVDIPGISVEEDEFDDVNEKKPAGATASSEANIDPLFGVDFDKLTAGPGIFMMAARFAVSIHRSFTYFCYTLPLSILYSFLAIPKRLFVHPPIWFLFAVFIRYIGKHVLGGEIPALDDLLEAEAKADEPPEEKPDLASSIASTNFLAMGTNFVKNFIKTNFPVLALLFTMLKDARTDMFVILCGFFIGLVFPSGLLLSSSVSDEL